MTSNAPFPPPAGQIEVEALARRLRAVIYVDTDEPRPRGLYVSPNAVDILGWPEDHRHLVERAWFEMIHPDDRDRFLRHQSRCVASGEPFDLDYRFVRPDGGIVWVHDHGVLHKDAEGRRSWQGVVLDITARVEAERIARAADLRFTTMEAQLPVVVYAVSDTIGSEVLYCSPNSIDVIGVSAEDFIAGRAPFPAFVDERDRDRVWNLWVHAFATKESFDAGYRMWGVDGAPIWVRDSARLVAPSDAQPFWQGVMLDVTAERMARDELTESESRHRALVENIPAVVYEMGPDDERRTLYVSPQIEALLGYSRREWLDQPDIWIELLHPDDREEALAAHDLQSLTGDPWSREYRLIAADGRTVWVRDAATLVRGSGEGPTVWQGLLTDVSAEKEAVARLRDAHDQLEFRVLERTTELEDANELMSLEIGERRRVERELRATQRRLRRIIEDVPAVVYTWQIYPLDPGEPDHAYTSPKIEDLLGFTPEEWNEEIWIDRMHPHDRDRAVQAAERSERTGEPYEVECRYLAKDGRVVWVLDRATLFARSEDGRPYVFQGVMIDVSARMEAELKASEAEARLQVLAEGGPVLAYAYDLGQGEPDVVHVRHVGPWLEEHLGVPAERWVEAIHPDDADGVRAAMDRHRGDGSPWNLEYRMIGVDGRIRWFNDRGRATEVDGAQRPRRLEGVLVEMTDAIERRRELEREVDQGRSLLEQMPGVAWTFGADANGRPSYLYVSPEATSVFGYTPQELMEEPHHFLRLVHPDDRARVTAGSLASDEEEAGGQWEDRYRVRHRDGGIRWVHARGRRATAFGETPAIWHGITIEIDPPDRSVYAADRGSSTRARSGT